QLERRLSELKSLLNWICSLTNNNGEEEVQVFSGEGQEKFQCILGISLQKVSFLILRRSSADGEEVQVFSAVPLFLT
ncbi:unnamed protein product, partial [Brassica napus]